MQNKKGTAGILIIVLLIEMGLGYFLVKNYGDDSGYDYREESEPKSSVDQIPNSEFKEVETTNDILGEIDDSLNYLE